MSSYDELVQLPSRAAEICSTKPLGGHFGSKLGNWARPVGSVWPHDMRLEFGQVDLHHLLVERRGVALDLGIGA